MGGLLVLVLVGLYLWIAYVAVRKVPKVWGKALAVRLEHFVHPLRWQRMLQSQPGHHAGRCMPLKPLDDSLPHPSSLSLAFNLRSTL